MFVKLCLSTAMFVMDVAHVLPLLLAEEVEVKVRAPDKKVEAPLLYRTSQLTSLPVRNTGGETLGKIEDVVVHFPTGKIRYVALSYGGFVGLGDKLFAVPWQAFTLKHGEKETYLLIDLPESKLEAAPGFDQSHWPDIADRAWAASIDKYYGIPADEERPTKEPAEPGKIVYDSSYRVSNITGMNVRNPANENLGAIHEVVLDVRNARVRYVVVSYGGILGLGDTLYAVPWAAFKLKHEAEDKHLVLNLSEDQIKQAPGFGSKTWPTDPNWTRDVDKYYEIHIQQRTSLDRTPRN